jgi:HEAT repeat protein
MREVKTRLAVVSIFAGLFLLPGFCSHGNKTASNDNEADGISHYISVLKSGSAQQKAAAAYRLGQQHSASSQAVNALVVLLSDRTEIDPSRYRVSSRDRKPTLGEEAAAALVQIGRPAIQQLIRVLKTSPSPEARKNAAWALGSLNQSNSRDEPPAA